MESISSILQCGSSSSSISKKDFEDSLIRKKDFIDSWARENIFFDLSIVNLDPKSIISLDELVDDVNEVYKEKRLRERNISDWEVSDWVDSDGGEMIERYCEIMDE